MRQVAQPSPVAAPHRRITARAFERFDRGVIGTKTAMEGDRAKGKAEGEDSGTHSETETSLEGNTVETAVQIDDDETPREGHLANTDATSKTMRAGCGCRANLKLWLNLGAVALGLALGLLLNHLNVSGIVLFWIGAASLNFKEGGRSGLILIGLIFLNNCIAIGSGLGVSYLVFQTHGGYTSNLTVSAEVSGNPSTFLATILRNLIPDNFVRMTFQQLSTTLSGEVIEDKSLPNQTTPYQITQEYINSPNALGFIFLSVIFGITAGLNRERCQPLIDFCKAVATLCITILSGLTWILPGCTLSLTAAAVGGIGPLGPSLAKMATFLGTLVGVVCFHQLVVLPLIIFVSTHRNPYIIIAHSWKVWILVFSTANSVLAIPEMFKTCENLAIPEAEAALGIPLALMTNTSGGGLYVAMATICISHLEGIQLSSFQVILVGILALTGMVSLSSVANGALAGIVLVTSSMGLPTSKLGLIIAVESMGDRIRSPSNVMATLSCVYATYKMKGRRTN